METKTLNDILEIIIRLDNKMDLFLARLNEDKQKLNKELD